MTFIERAIQKNTYDMINKDIQDIDWNGYGCIVSDNIITIYSHKKAISHKEQQKRQKFHLKSLQKEIGGQMTQNVHKEWRLEIHHNIDSIRRKNSFIIDDYIQIDCKTTIDDNGNEIVIVPQELKKIFNEKFPSIKITTEDAEWKFTEYSGGYPCLCSGNTIFQCGNTTIITKIISNNGFEWKVQIPTILNHIPFEPSLFKWDGEKFNCCGGCE